MASILGINLSELNQTEVLAKIADFLNSNGKNFFFCERDKQVSEDSDYLSRIDSALESAEHMVVIGTKKEFFGSGWVRHEWTSFLKEKLGGRKKGNT